MYLLHFNFALCIISSRKSFSLAVYMLRELSSYFFSDSLNLPKSLKETTFRLYLHESLSSISLRNLQLAFLKFCKISLNTKDKMFSSIIIKKKEKSIQVIFTFHCFPYLEEKRAIMINHMIMSSHTCFIEMYRDAFKNSPRGVAFN